MLLYFDELPKELKVELLRFIYDDYNYHDFGKDELNKLDTFNSALICN